MSKTIYVKYSNERSRELSIITKIIQDEEGNKSLVKVPAFAEAKKHVENMEKYYKSLNENYRNSEKIDINKCALNKDGTVAFEFINGETLEQRLDLLVNKGQYKQAIITIKDYFDELKKYNSSVKFQKTEEFVNIFGNVSTFENSHSGKINDIDRVFGNVILNNNKYIFIDYEWSFEFPVPLEYILFRAVHYYVNSEQQRKILIDEGIYDLIGLNKEQIDECLLMESNFQKYVSGTVASLGMLHDDMVKENAHMNDILYGLNAEKRKKNIRIYFDEGEGFSEENSKMYMAEKNGSEFSFKVNFDKNYKRVRIDVTEEQAVIKISDFSLNNISVCDDEFVSTNGYQLEKNVWAFMDGDPNFMIDKDIKSGDSISITYSIDNVGKNAALSIKDAYQKKDNAYQKIKSDYAELSNKLECADITINELMNSFSWRITKPIRKIGSLLRK